MDLLAKRRRDFLRLLRVEEKRKVGQTPDGRRAEKWRELPRKIARNASSMREKRDEKATLNKHSQLQALPIYNHLEAITRPN